MEIEKDEEGMKIDKNGWLWLKRKGKYKAQYCPYQPKEVRCGDWCPNFEAPDFYWGYYNLQICQSQILQTETLIDEREGSDVQD